jgi:hypothetical protein
MAENDLQAYSFWVVRNTPNLVRDECLSVAVLLPGSRRGRF